MFIPKNKVTKNTTPIIYLDTNALIELSRYEKGCCKIDHRDKIEELYHTLETLKQKKRILCACGNQMEEMGASQARHEARNFLLRFTNVEFKSPFQIKDDQLKSGFQAFMKNDTTIVFYSTDIIEETTCINSTSIEIHAVSSYSKDQAEEFKQGKEQLAAMLNEVKNCGRIAANYDAQLDLELKADYQVFQYNMEHCSDSQQCYMNMLDSFASAFSCVRMNPYYASDKDKTKAIDNYMSFLISSYHHSLPYIWIRSVLFAHIIQRQNKIIPSDNLDIKWASAYLPFVDYVVTDSTFCNLLNKSGLAAEYGTKVYCFKSLNSLLEKLHLEDSAASNQTYYE